MIRHAFALSLLAGFIGFGCASAPPPAPPPPPPQNALQAEMVGAPKWVQMGCGAFFGEKKNLVCGVGAISGMSDISIARTAAQGRGRTEIARSLRLRVKSMLKDYAAVTKGGPGQKLNNETHVEDVSKQVTDMTLTGTRIQDTWVSNAGTMWVLMVLDVESFKGSLKDMQGLDEQLRAAIVKRAEKSFSELNAETEQKPAKSSAE